MPAAEEDLVVVPEAPQQPAPEVPDFLPPAAVVEDVAEPAAAEQVFMPQPATEEEIFSVPEPAVEEENFTMPDPDPVEEDALMIFNKEWNATLEEKRAAEFEAEKEARATAEKELAEWNTQREIRLQAKKDSNRSEEQVTVEAVTSEVDAIKTWDRVAKLIDAGETTDAKGSDTSRMRKLFIQLKNEPLETTRAAALA